MNMPRRLGEPPRRARLWVVGRLDCEPPDGRAPSAWIRLTVLLHGGPPLASPVRRHASWSRWRSERCSCCTWRRVTTGPGSLCSGQGRSRSAAGARRITWVRRASPPVNRVVSRERDTAPPILSPVQAADPGPQCRQAPRLHNPCAACRQCGTGRTDRSPTTCSGRRS